MVFTMIGDHKRQLHEGLATCFNEPDSRKETLPLTANMHRGKAQPGGDLQQHVHDVVVSAIVTK